MMQKMEDSVKYLYKIILLTRGTVTQIRETGGYFEVALEYNPGPLYPEGSGIEDEYSYFVNTTIALMPKRR